MYDRFPLWSPRFCKSLVNKFDNATPSQRPNSMNRYGMPISDLGVGMELWADGVMRRIVEPSARAYWPELLPLKRCYAFLVDYEPHKQADLKTHTDSSDVTLNVCLGRVEDGCETFTGGDIAFYEGRELVAQIEHRVGYAIVHRGDATHRALPIKKGRRTNLILWCLKK